MATDNAQESIATPTDPYRQTLQFNIDIKKEDIFDIEITTKREIKVEF